MSRSSKRPLLRSRASSGQAKRGGQKGSAAPIAHRGSGDSQMDPAVTAFLRGLKHPLKKEIEAVRQMILGVSPEIREVIKWNAPSFRTTDFFATVNLRSTDTVQLIFHKGAKMKDNSTEMQISDPSCLIKWLAKDRCMVTLGAGKEIQANQAAFESMVGEWIRQL